MNDSEQIIANEKKLIFIILLSWLFKLAIALSSLT